jgi:tetratricopeptide (TPR) repeat protein
MTCGWLSAVPLVALVSVHTTVATPPGPGSPAVQRQERFQGEEALARVYDTILDARFDQVEAELRRACGPAPPEACDVLTATAVWWRILLDPDSRLLDEEFSASVERAIRTTTAWTSRAPDNAEAWFYLGGAYAARVQWRVLRHEKLSAARDGKRIKDALERAIALDPGLEDAGFGIGMYRYYADVAPMAARILRFLLLLPGGDREAGLAQMQRARDHGRLLDGEADYQLHVIYLWYEQDTERALELLRSLGGRYPGNPLFLTQIAEIQDTYQHDITASLGTWRALLTLARERRVNAAGLAAARAQLGIAGHLDTLHQTDHALEQLDALVRSKPEVPEAALALAYLRLGEAHDRLGHRDTALASYRRAVAAAPAPDVHEVAERARRRMRHAPDARRAEAYRLSIEGLRRLEQQDVDGGAAALSRSLALNPHDPVAHYRYGRVLRAQRDDAAALEQFERALRDAADCPAPILATAYLEGARLYERSGQRDRALAWYRSASTLFGAAEDTRTAALRALARLEK